MKTQDVLRKNPVYKKWLGGKTLEEKIKTLEIEELIRCARCGVVFSKSETPSTRRACPCRSKQKKHRLVSHGRHIVLQRYPLGVQWAILCSVKDDIKKEILDFFRIQKNGESQHGN